MIGEDHRIAFMRPLKISVRLILIDFEPSPPCTLLYVLELPPPPNSRTFKATHLLINS